MENTSLQGASRCWSWGNGIPPASLSQQHSNLKSSRSRPGLSKNLFEGLRLLDLAAPDPAPDQPWPVKALEGLSSLSLPLTLGLTILHRIDDFHAEPPWQLPGSFNVTRKGNNPFWPADRGGGTDTLMVSPRVDCGAFCAGERGTPLDWFLKVIDFNELNSRGWRTRLGNQKEQGWAMGRG